MGLADDLVLQFRSLAIERIERIEAAWAQVLTSLDSEASTLIHREVHTLKAESRVVNFLDVNQLCHKLEDLIDVARARGYAVDDDYDLGVTLALAFMAMLVKARGGAARAYDLPGFVRHLDALLKRYEHTGRTRPGSVPPVLRAATTTRVSSAMRAHLGPAAVDAFVEYAVARGPRRDRLRASWYLLRDLIGLQRAVISSEQLAKYKPSIGSLARELGKQVELKFDIATTEVTSEVFHAIDVAALHLLRNAVDHGIEPAAARVAAGKPAAGAIRLRAGMRGEVFELVVEDDGRGIDFERVRQRAVELGMIGASAVVAHDRLVELMCHPGFSTRSEASEVSGRGVGLDAVRGAAVDLGGGVVATSQAGRGVAFTIAVPMQPVTVQGFLVRAPGLRFPVVVAAPWRLLDKPLVPVIVDLAVALGHEASTSISSVVWGFANDTGGGAAVEIGLLCGDKPQLVQARRLVPTAPSALAEVVSVEGVEGLLLRPERVPGVM